MARKILLLIMLAVLGLPARAGAQAWSNFLDTSRAIDWLGTGFTIPNYTTPCAIQPSLSTGSTGSIPANNTAAISAAISSCDATHNVVNIPSGTYYTRGIFFNGQNKVVLRGAGANSSYIYIMPPAAGCYGYTSVGVCMGGNALYAQSAAVQPGQDGVCNWTAGYAQGTTNITVNSCPTPPTNGLLAVLDQADDGADNTGFWKCSSYDLIPSPRCTQNGPKANADGRVIPPTGSTIQYSQQQLVKVTGVSGSGTGPYTVTVDPPVYFNDVSSGKTPGFWQATSNATLEGIEEMTLDHSLDTVSQIGGLMIWCNQCWFQNNRSIDGLENHLDMISALSPVVQNNYFYGSQHGGSSSYCVQMEEVSNGLVQNNIMQNTTSPDIKDAVTGSVTAYNFTPYINFGSYMQGLYASHNSGSAYNLLEGNATTSFIADDVWGTGGLITIFRNHATGWQPTYVNQTFPIGFNAGVRDMNVIGNVMGEPGYHTQYEAYATSTTAGVFRTTPGGSTSSGSGNVNQSIYELGWTDTSGLGVCNTPPVCDPLTWSTLMRWGNWDTVGNAARFNATEASPAANTGVNANFTSGYFGSLTHTLPDSLYLATKPAWFGSLPFPSYGPDVTSGTTGICSGGTYAGLWAENSGDCPGGTFVANAWGGHANLNPAQYCYLHYMNGPPDGSGGVLPFNPHTCYAAAATLVSIAVTPTTPSIAVGLTQAFTAIGTYSDSSTADITSSVTWASATPAHATINASTGVATGVATGTTNITATLSAITSNTAVLTVTSANLVSIAITPAPSSVSVGNTVAFTAIGTYSDSSTANITTMVTWGSSATSKATIVSSGVATGVAAGTTNITATLSAVTSNTSVLTVSAPVLVSIAVTPSSPSIIVGGGIAFTATGTYSDSSTADISSSVTWQSSDTGKATIASGGVATGVAVGTTNITATLSAVTSPIVVLTVTTPATVAGKSIFLIL